MVFLAFAEGVGVGIQGPGVLQRPGRATRRASQAWGQAAARPGGAGLADPARSPLRSGRRGRGQAVVERCRSSRTWRAALRG